MFNLITGYIFLFILAVLYNFVFRRCYKGKFYCGIFAFCGNPTAIDRGTAKAIQAKFKILGLYNIERGKHSCGVFTGDQILKGVNNDKLFSDFIQNNQFPFVPDSEHPNYTMIGHTRMATHGDHTYDNAHPFLVDDDFVIAHNGVIRNVWHLCNKYGINHSKIKVDSLGLGHLINQEGFKVLSEYQGFAALLMTRISEPNTLYIYKGVSRLTYNGELQAERPLFYMQSEEGIYVSSLEKSLLAISDSSKDKIHIVDGNVVQKITNGRITKSKFSVNRDSVNFGVSTNTHGGSPSANFPKESPSTSQAAGSSMTRNGFGGATRTDREKSGSTTTTDATNCSVGNSYHTNRSVQPHSAGTLDKVIVPVIWHETLPENRMNKFKDKTYFFFQFGRFWMVKGKEISIPHGSYYANRKGVVNEERTKDTHNFWFYEGALLRDQRAWNQANSDERLKGKEYNFALNLSRYTLYPVCNSRTDVYVRNTGVSTYFKYRWYEDGGLAGNTGFTPKFADRCYTIRESLLHSVETNGGRKPKPLKESCINRETLTLERNSVEGMAYENSRPPAIILPEKAGSHNEKEEIFHQTTIPFKKDQIDKSEIDDLTNFYIPFVNIENAVETLSATEQRALRYYTADIMFAEMNLPVNNVYDPAVDIQMNMYIAMCVDTNMSLYDMWDEKQYNDIHYYLKIAAENCDGTYLFDYDAPNDETCSGDSCSLKPEKFSDFLQGSKKITVDNVNEVFPPEEDDHTNIEAEAMQMMVDEYRSREQAQVPAIVDAESDIEKAEEITMNEQKEYGFKDAIDDMTSMRGCADELVTLKEDDFAQEVACVIYKTIDPLFAKINKLCLDHEEGELGKYLLENAKANKILV